MAFRNWYRALAASLHKTQTSGETVFINVTGKEKKKKRPSGLSILSAHTKIISSSSWCFYVWTMTANLSWSMSTWLRKKEWQSLHQQVSLCPTFLRTARSAAPTSGLHVPRVLSQQKFIISPSAVFCAPAFYWRVSWSMQWSRILRACFSVQRKAEVTMKWPRLPSSGATVLRYSRGNYHQPTFFSPEYIDPKTKLNTEIELGKFSYSGMVIFFGTLSLTYSHNSL